MKDILSILIFRSLKLMTKPFRALKLMTKPFRGSKLPFVNYLYDHFLSSIYKLSKPKNRFLLIDVQGSKMWVDAEDYAISYYLITRGIYEPRETNLFKKIVRHGMTVIDLGANIGYYTLIASKLVGESGKVYAFEPEPDNFNILVKNININNLKNVVVE